MILQADVDCRAEMNISEKSGFYADRPWYHPLALARRIINYYLVICVGLFLLQDSLLFPRWMTGAVLSSEEAAMQAMDAGLVPSDQALPGAFPFQGYVRKIFPSRPPVEPSSCFMATPGALSTGAIMWTLSHGAASEPIYMNTPVTEDVRAVPAPLPSFPTRKLSSGHWIDPVMVPFMSGANRSGRALPPWLAGIRLCRFTVWP
jgi:hypothetical protein